VGIAGRGAYHASKRGVLGLTKSAALEYASRGIRINAVCPGIIETPMVADMLAREAEAMKELMKEVPIARLGRSEEIPCPLWSGIGSWLPRCYLPATSHQAERTTIERCRFTIQPNIDRSRRDLGRTCEWMQYLKPAASDLFQRWPV
jgi:short-subunit dehydrogenase